MPVKKKAATGRKAPVTRARLVTAALTGGPAAAAEKAEPIDARGQIQKLIAELNEDRARLAANPKASGRDRASVVTGLATATRLLAQLDGTKEITTSQILRSRQWGAVMRAAVAALAPYPGAYDSLAAALEAMP